MTKYVILVSIILKPIIIISSFEKSLLRNKNSLFWKKFSVLKKLQNNTLENFLFIITNNNNEFLEKNKLYTKKKIIENSNINLFHEYLYLYFGIDYENKIQKIKTKCNKNEKIFTQLFFSVYNLKNNKSEKNISEFLQYAKTFFSFNHNYYVLDNKNELNQYIKRLGLINKTINKYNKYN
jgi:hypothetical protein